MGRIQGKETIVVKWPIILDGNGKWHFLICKSLERAGIVVRSPRPASSVSQFPPTVSAYSVMLTFPTFSHVILLAPGFSHYSR